MPQWTVNLKLPIAIRLRKLLQHMKLNTSSVVRRRGPAAAPWLSLVYVGRDGSLTAPGGPTMMPAEESRSQIDEQPIPKLGGPTYKQVKPKTYQVLEEQLQSSADSPPPAASGIRTWAVSYIYKYFFLIVLLVLVTVRAVATDRTSCFHPSFYARQQELL